VRTAGLGSAIGFDHAAFFFMSEMLGYDRRALAGLLPFMESALIEALQDKQKHGDENGIDPAVG
jgi:hypothetical protein